MWCTWLAENQDAKKSQSGYDRTTLPCYIFATKACIDNRKKLVNSNISSMCPHNMGNFGPLAAEIDSGVRGTRANFNGFRVLAVLLHGTLVVGVNQTLRRWTEGATCIRQGGHHVGHWPTFSLFIYLWRIFVHDGSNDGRLAQGCAFFGFRWHCSPFRW